MDIKMRIGVGLLLLAILTAPLPVWAEKASEEAIKAAVVHKITKFVQWPNSSNEDAPIRFCVAGSRSILQAMSRLQSHSGKGRALAVSAVDSPTESALRCDALYISDSGVDEPARWLAVVQSLPILTFAESDDYDGVSGIVTLRIHNNKVRFDIDGQASSRAGITIGAQLLQLAAMSNGRKR